MRGGPTLPERNHIIQTLETGHVKEQIPTYCTAHWNNHHQQPASYSNFGKASENTLKDKYLVWQILRITITILHDYTDLAISYLDTEYDIFWSDFITAVHKLPFKFYKILSQESLHSWYLFWDVWKNIRRIVVSITTPGNLLHKRNFTKETDEVKQWKHIHIYM